MEKEPICYVCQSEGKMETLKEIWSFCRRPLECTGKDFWGQKIVCVYIPVLHEKYEEKGEAAGSGKCKEHEGHEGDRKCKEHKGHEGDGKRKENKGHEGNRKCKENKGHEGNKKCIENNGDAGNKQGIDNNGHERNRKCEENKEHEGYKKCIENNGYAGNRQSKKNNNHQGNGKSRENVVLRQRNRLVRWLYFKHLQSKMWDVILTYQNASMQPAFCSKEIFDRFCNNTYLRNELWISTKIPSPIVELSLYLFLKKECAFHRTTKVFVVDNSEIDVENLLFPYCCKMNYLQLLTLDRDRYERFADEVYEESGLAIGFTTGGEQAEEADIIINLSEDFEMSPMDINKGCIYFDAYADEEREKSIRASRRDVTVISSRNYLDRALRSTL